MLAVGGHRSDVHVVPLDARPQDSELHGHRLDAFSRGGSVQPRRAEERSGARVWPHLVIAFAKVVEA